jgi:hypothetical protein
MDAKLLLAKAITLLYREGQTTDKTENSSDLIKNVIETVKPDEIGIVVTTEKEVIKNLRDTVLEMCQLPQDHTYDKVELLQRVRINTSNDDKLYDAIKQGIDDDLIETALKRNIVNIRKSINNHFKEHKITTILNDASSNFKYKRDKIKDPNQFIADLIQQLDVLQISNTAKDAAIIDDIDIGDENGMHRIFTNVFNSNNGSRLYKTGWQALNNMTQGGFRPGETVVVGALQHKYKTGFTLSLFGQIALFNKPLTTDKTKKPLLLRISFEDDLVNNLQFIYQYLKYNETREYVDIRNVTIDEMSSYVKEKLQVNGFHIKMMRVDPDQWTYKSICNKIIELEAEGYNIEVLMVDYLSKLPTTGCNVSGAMGNDVMDQLSRVRNFCAGRGILFITPHQLSTEAKALIRSGVPENQFVNEIAERGYWEKTKGLDRIFDLGLIIHLFKHNKETFFSVARDKHRISSIVDDKHKYYMMKFPKGMPIPHDIDGEDTSFNKLPSVVSNASDDLFKLG